MRRFIYIFISIALLIGLLVAGCQPGQPEPAGVLNLYDIDPLTLDPAITGEMTSHQYIAQIFSGLVRLDENLEPAPDIAREWDISEDGRTYTFYLREDVRFHDGREVKAQDFKYSWERAGNPATGSQTAGTYLNDIVGVKEVLAGESKDISGVRVIDDYTLEVTIDAPKSYFLYKLSYPTGFVVDRTNVESGGEWWHSPNGTGPFRLKQWDENELVVLERNEFYYGDKAEIEQVKYHLWAGVPMSLYETGEIDVAGVPISYIDKVTDPSGLFHDELQISPELSFQLIGFNTTRPPFDDVNIRRAFSMAIDKDRLVSLVYRNMVEKAEGILPEGIPGFNESLSGPSYDVAGARELIAGSGYGDVSNLPEITLTTSGWGGLLPAYLEAVVAEWRRNLGVEVKVRQLEPERYIYHLKEEKDELFSMGWVADYPHPQNFLEILFRSGAENNYGEYSNPGIDALLDEAGLEMDRERSLALYQQAEQILVQDAACLPLWFGENYILVKPYVQGYELDPQGLVKLNRVSVEP